MKKKNHLLFWILFPIGWTLITALLVFYFDLANGPLVFFILELVLLVVFFIVRTLFRTPNGNPLLFNCRDENEPWLLEL